MQVKLQELRNLKPGDLVVDARQMTKIAICIWVGPYLNDDGKACRWIGVMNNDFQIWELTYPETGCVWVPCD